MIDEIKKISEECNELGISYELDRHDCIKLPGRIQKVYWDAQPGVEPGLCAEWEDGFVDPIEIDEIISELRNGE